jgi:predicted ferric reductase
MWAVFITALLAATRKRFRISPKLWRMAHKGLASVIVVGTIMHAYLIQGTMEFYSKIGLSALLFLASANIIFGLEKRFLSK